MDWNEKRGVQAGLQEITFAGHLGMMQRLELAEIGEVKTM